MPKVLTNGEIKIGAYQLPNRKRPSLCVEEGNRIVICGTFQNAERADWLMDKIGECIGQSGWETDNDFCSYGERRGK